MRGSRGKRASLRPVGVRARPPGADGFCSMACSSSSRRMPSRTARVSGFSRNSKRSMSPRPSAVICSTTLASEVRRISGSVNSGRAAKSSSENRRMAMPGAVRPDRPERCWALAWLIGSMGRRCTLVRWE